MSGAALALEDSVEDIERVVMRGFSSTPEIIKIVKITTDMQKQFLKKILS